MVANAIMTLVIGVGALLAHLSPRAVTATFVAATMMLPPLIFQLGLSFGTKGNYVSLIVLGALLGCGFYLYRVSVGTLETALLDLAVLAYIGFTFVTSAVVSRPAINLSYIATLVRQFALPVLFYYTGRLYFGNQRGTRLLHALIAVALAFAVGFTVFEYVTRYNPYVDASRWLVSKLGTSAFEAYVPQERFQLTGFYRVLGPMVEPTESAIGLLLGATVLIGFHRLSPTARRPLSTLLIGLSTLLIVLSTTRGVMIATGALLLVSSGWVRSARRVLFVLGLAAGGAALVLRESIMSSAFFTTRILNPETIVSRIAAYATGWSLFRSSPLLGVGIGTPVDALGYEGGDVFTTHSFYLDKLVHTGIIGLALLAMLHATILRRALGLRRADYPEFVRGHATTYVLLLLGVGTVYLLNPEKLLPSGLVWLFAGGVVSQWRSHRKARTGAHTPDVAGARPLVPPPGSPDARSFRSPV